MACNCNSIVAEKVLGDFRLKTPNATEHSVILLNYALVFDNGFTEKAFMMASQCANFPTKKGTYVCKTKRLTPFTLTALSAVFYIPTPATTARKPKQDKLT